MENMEAIIEGIVAYLQSNKGHSAPKDIPAWDSNRNDWGVLQLRLVHYGLVEPPKDSQGITLTEKGWEFESFEKLRQEKQLQRDLIKANIDTNKSIQDLNDKTDTYYKNQTDFNKTQRRLTYAIAIATAIYTLFSVLTFFNGCHRNELHPLCTPIQSQQIVPQSNKTMQYPVKNDSVNSKKVDTIK